MDFLREKIKLRLYQQTILASCNNKNSLVVLPTGLGKTYVAIGLAGLKVKKGLVIMMAPTKPLCVQHKNSFAEFFKPEEKLGILTGSIPPSERKLLWSTSKLFFCTPQTLVKDIMRGYVDLKDVALLVFDEAHRATGDYSYVSLAKEFSKRSTGHILALSASPASSKDKLDEVCGNLDIKNIEIKTEEDVDVSKYIKEKEIVRVEVELPKEIKVIQSLLEKSLISRLNKLRSAGLVHTAEVSKLRKSDLLALQKRLGSELSSKKFEAYGQISTVASCLKLQHALAMVQTQSIETVIDFFKKLEQQAKTVKASKRLLADVNFRKAVTKAYEAAGEGLEHPKFSALRNMLVEEFSEDMRAIVFASYRSSISRLISMLKKIDGINPVKFIGQKRGMSQKRQVATLEKFKEGKYNVLVASSISEEGLHVENADLGIFFEPVPSALRSIQRRGRIGRVNIGKVYLLITKDTIDEKYYWSSLHKERRMADLLNNLRDDLNSGQTKLSDI